jgi:hypothetical protein
VALGLDGLPFVCQTGEDDEDDECFIFFRPQEEALTRFRNVGNLCTEQYLILLMENTMFKAQVKVVAASSIPGGLPTGRFSRFGADQ